MNNTKIRNIIFFTIITLLFAACGASENSSSTTVISGSSGSSSSTSIDIEVMSVEALNTSGAVITNSARIEGKDELKLKVILKNVGSKTINSDSAEYKYSINIINHNNSVSYTTKNITISDLDSLEPNQTIEVEISTNHLLQNTDKSYEFIFNSNNLNQNTLDEKDYTNNKKSIDNIIFEDIEFEVYNNFSGIENGAGVFQDTQTYNSNNKYGHRIAVKNTSSFKFYGYLTLSVENSPYLYEGTGTYSITQSDVFEIKGLGIEGVFEYPITRPNIVAGTYPTSFKVDWNDSDNTNNKLNIDLIVKK